MKKCIIMFAFLVIAMVIASTVENRNEKAPSADYVLESNNPEGLLVNANTKK